MLQVIWISCNVWVTSAVETVCTLSVLLVRGFNGKTAFLHSTTNQVPYIFAHFPGWWSP